MNIRAEDVRCHHSARACRLIQIGTMTVSYRGTYKLASSGQLASRDTANRGMRSKNAFSIATPLCGWHARVLTIGDLNEEVRTGCGALVRKSNGGSTERTGYEISLNFDGSTFPFALGSPPAR